METDRSSHLQMFFKIGVLKNFAIFTGKHRSWSLFLTALQVSNFIKKRHQHKCFPVYIVKFLRIAFGGCFVIPEETYNGHFFVCACVKDKPLVKRHDMQQTY